MELIISEEVLRYQQFYKQFIIRRTGDFSSVALFDSLTELPTGSILHTISNLTTGFGDDTNVVPDDAIYQRYMEGKKRNILPILSPSGEGSALPSDLSGIRPRPSGIKKGINNYKNSMSGQVFIMGSLDSMGFSAQFQNIVSYEPLSRIVVTGIDETVRVFNMVMNTVFSNIIELSDRDNFIVFETDNTQFKQSDFTRSYGKYTRQTIKFSESTYFLIVMHLMGFLYSDKTDSVFDKLPDHVLEHTNIIFQNGNKFVTYNLKTLSELQTKSPETSKSLLRQLNGLSQMPDLVHDEVNKDLVNIPMKPEESNTTKFLKTPSPEEVASTAKQSTATRDAAVTTAIMTDNNLSDKQKEFVLKLSQEYKKIDVNGESVEDILHVPTDITTNNSDVSDVVGDIPDKSLARSALATFDIDFVDKAMKKYVVDTLVGFSMQGMFLTSLEESDVSDSLSNIIKYVAVFTDKHGKKHRVEFTVPKVSKDGTCKINGSIKSMGIQRVNTPICKVSDTRVSLSSNFNKTIVERNASFSNNFLKYVKRIIVKAGDRITVNIGDNNYEGILLPYEYTQLGSTYTSIMGPGFQWIFDYDARHQIRDGSKGYERRKAGEEKYGVYIGTSGRNLTFLDVQGVLTIISNEGNVIESTSILSFLNNALEDIKFPAFNEWVNYNVLGKKLPVMFVLAYRFGFKEMLDYLNISYKSYGVRERIVTDIMDIVISLEGEKLVFEKLSTVNRLLLSGMSSFNLKEFSLEDLSGKDTYYDLMQSLNMSVNYLKGVDDIFEFFVDPVTRDVLIQMGEPTNVRDLLIRATALLVTEDYKEASSEQNMRYRSYERFNDIIYKQLAKALATHGNSGVGQNSKFSINPFEILAAISTDQLFNNLDIVNPVDDLKSRFRFSHSGDGGRSKESMVVSDRRFPDDGVGIMSACTVDSGAVGIEGILTGDPGVVNLLGMTKHKSIDDLEPGQIMSLTTALYPAADMDD